MATTDEGACVRGKFTEYCKGNVALTSPTLDLDNNLCVISPVSAEVYTVVDMPGVGAQFHLRVRCDGLYPNSFAFDAEGTIYICDFATKAVCAMRDFEDAPPPSTIIADYEGKPLKGPNNLAFDREGNMYFTDSGPFGETTLGHPTGSVFTVLRQGQILKPLAYECLAHPSGIAVSPCGNFIYVCETMSNRVLRFILDASGVYHMSTFHQFAGGLGPVALATDDAGHLYVARFDFSSASSRGLVSVLDSTASLLHDIGIPESEVTGVALRREPNGRVVLYVTETSTQAVHAHVMA